MNIPQKLLLGLALIAVVGMCVLPPWFYDYHYVPPSGIRTNPLAWREMRSQRFAGYHAIWGDNIPSDQSVLSRTFNVPYEMALPTYFTTKVDATRLTIQVIGLLIVTSFLCLLLKSRPRSIP